MVDVITINDNGINPPNEVIAEADAMNTDGICCFNSRDYHGALEAFSAAILVHPRYEAAYRCRAEALRWLGRFSEAALDLNKAESIKLNWQGKAAREAAFMGGISIPFIATVIPILLLSVLSMGRIAVLVGAPDWLEDMYLFWVAGIAVWMLSVCAAIIFAFARRELVAKEMIVGARVGISVLVVTWVLHIVLPLTEFG